MTTTEPGNTPKPTPRPGPPRPGPKPSAVPHHPPAPPVAAPPTCDPHRFGRVDDDGMCALLEPWRGHRQRVIRLIGLSGAVEPRRGPRLAPEDHRGR